MSAAREVAADAAARGSPYRQLAGRMAACPSALTTLSGNWLSLSVLRPMVNDAAVTSRNCFDAR